MAWDHGYFSALPYTCGVYRELAPAWLDFAALLKGHQPPRRSEGDGFSYLELGSGMGFGLCLLAAAYPEGQFCGIDFQPDHIVHSRRLAADLGLGNVRFDEADFLTLVRQPGDLLAAHDYVAAHGIATWIAAPVQRALLQLASACLRPGGLFYCSYNTFPGWLAASSYQHLGDLLSRRRSPASAGQALQEAASGLSALLGSTEAPSALALALPGLRDRLDKIPGLDPGYLVQEYRNDGWQPLYVAQMHQRAAEHKLRFHASASLPENFLELLPANVRPTVVAEPDPALRQSLIDLAINQSFRRDLFLRGFASCTTTELQQRLDGLLLRLQEAPPTDTYHFETSFGRVSGATKPCQTLEEALADGPRTFSALRQHTGLGLSDLARLVALLLHAGRLGLDRGDAINNGSALAANSRILELMRSRRPYSHLVAPSTGGSVGFSVVEALLEDGIQRGLGEGALEQHLTEGLTGLGRALKGEAAQAMASYAERRPRLQALGVLSRP